jgi:DNA-binding transcriptional LysR family regulator
LATIDPDRVLRRLKLRELHVLRTVAEAGSMARAAEILSITRPVVTKAILDLERTVGVRLFDRNRTGVEPTAFGRALLRRSIVVFDELRQGVRELAYLASPAAGELNVGCSEYIAAGLAPVVINRLSQKFPDVLFRLSLGDANSLQLHELRERKVEFAIARLLGPKPEPDMQAETLFYEDVFIAAGPGNKWVGRRNVKLAELVDAPWILAPPEIVEGSTVLEAFRALGLNMPQAKVLGLSLPLRNGLLATGRFLTIVPGSVIRFGAERQLLSVLPVELPRWRLPVAILTVKGRTLTPLAQLFLDCVRETIEALPPRRPVRSRADGGIGKRHR